MEQRPSLVDDTEAALRSWLATGAYREGHRLPPELELAAMLGVSRGTLRTALDRLADTGEIKRRQGSGTYVGAARPSPFLEGLEVLRPYSELAQRRGVVLGARDVTIAQRRIGSDAAEGLGLPASTEALVIARTVLADREPVAVMCDTVAPSVRLPSEPRLRKAIGAGAMVVDLLLEAGVGVAYAATSVRPRLVSKRDRVGIALGVQGTTAVLELDEVMHDAAGVAVQHSSDLFAPGGIDLRVRRHLDPAGLVPAPARG